MNRIFIALSGFLTMLGFSGMAQKSQVIAPQEFKEKLSVYQQPQLIDVRTPQEFKAGHLKGAKLITLQSQDFQLQMQQLDQSRPIFLYCQMGGRSAAAARRLTDMGFPEIYDLRGGIGSWAAAGLPITKN